jgi:septum formation protein
MNKRIILASTSSRRKELLSKTGLAFEVVPCKYEEDMTLPMTPHDLAMFLSRGKAESIVSDFPNSIIISGDTFLAFEDKVLGKPHTPERAYEMLKMLSGNMHYVITGFTIIDTDTNQSISKSVESKVYFKEMTDEEIHEYIATGEPLEKAGGYAIQLIGSKFIDRTEGDMDNIIGLPVVGVVEELKSFGILV